MNWVYFFKIVCSLIAIPFIWIGMIIGFPVSCIILGGKASYELLWSLGNKGRKYDVR